MDREEPKLRPCLGRCGKLFRSPHKGRRICPRCTDTINGVARPGELALATAGGKYRCRAPAVSDWNLTTGEVDPERTTLVGRNFTARE